MLRLILIFLGSLNMSMLFIAGILLNTHWDSTKEELLQYREFKESDEDFKKNFLKVIKINQIQIIISIMVSFILVVLIYMKLVPNWMGIVFVMTMFVGNYLYTSNMLFTIRRNKIISDAKIIKFIFATRKSVSEMKNIDEANFELTKRVFDFAFKNNISEKTLNYIFKFFE